MVSFFMVLGCGAFLVGGCAKKEMVKGEEPIPSATRPAETAPAKTPAREAAPAQQMKGPGQAVKEEPLKEPSGSGSSCP